MKNLKPDYAPDKIFVANYSYFDSYIILLFIINDFTMTVLEAIIYIKEKKQKENRFPTHAMLKEIYELVPPIVAQDEIEQLIADGVIRIGETVNSKYVEFN